MNMTKLREEFSTLQTEALGVLEKAEKEEREVTADEKTANEKRFTRINAIKTSLDEHAKFAQMKLDDPADPAVPGTLQTPTEPDGRQQFTEAMIRQQFMAKTGETKELAFERHLEAVNQFIRTGRDRTNQYTLTTATGGNVLLPVTTGTPILIKRLVNPVRAALISRGLKVISTDTMELINLPVFDDTANTADVIAQDSTSENVKEPVVTGVQLGAALYDSGTVWNSNTLLNSLNYDLLGYLQPMLDSRIDITQGTAWMTKLTTAPTIGVTTASTAGVTFQELLAWQHSIPIANRPYGAFIVSDGLFRAIRGLVDNQNRPIYQESLTDDAPDKLLGWPVFPSPDLPNPGPGLVSGVAVAVNLLAIRDVTNRRIARYVNIPTRPDQFGIREFANGDFGFVASGVRALKHAAA